MKKTFKPLLITCISVFVLSCSQETFSPNKNQLDSNGILIPSTAQIYDGTTLREGTDSNFENEEFAKLLAASLKDKEFRSFLKNEANKKFDGDFDILVKNIKNSKIGNDSFSDKVKKNNPNGLAKGNELFEKVTKNEKLNISIPVLIENWDETKVQLLVAVVVGVNEKTISYLKAFDSNGKAYLIDAKTEPNVPVIVITNNERMDMDFKKIKNASKALRVSGATERVTYLRCPNLNAIESWFYGAPEIRFDGVVYNNDFTAAFLAFSKTVIPGRDHAKGGIYFNQDLFEWYFDDNQGPDYFIQTMEMDDSGNSVSFEVGVSAGKKDATNGTAKLTLTYKEEDKKLAGELIHYTSSSPRLISDSYIQFILQQ